jgi:hypothetical protein
MARNKATKWYVGNNPRLVAKQTAGQRFFYGLRAEGGELILGKVDSLDSDDGIVINGIGDYADQDFPHFIPGSDFFEGIDEFHETRYGNLIYSQYKFDDRDFNYYVDDNGELTLRVFQGIGEGTVLIPDVPLRPPQVDYRKLSVFPTFDLITITFDNKDLKFDNEDPNG